MNTGTSTRFLKTFLFSNFRCFSNTLSPQKVQGLVSVKTLRNRLEEHLIALQQLKPISNDKMESLSPRGVRDSYDCVVLPLGTDIALRESYLNFMGYIRFGLLLEDLDTFAVWLSYRHNQGMENHGKPPVHHPMRLVTACVDRIDLKTDTIQSDRDIVLEGYVSWVGRSSVEATMHLYQENEEKTAFNSVLDAQFVMVATDPFKSKSVTNHPLVPETEKEKSDFEHGQAAKSLRKEQANMSLLKNPPDVEERIVLHNLFLQTLDENSHTFRHRLLPANHVWMEECRLKNVIICHPQERNLYNKIFGGFLMRSAFELAWANARLFCKSRPHILAVDDIIFRKSVDIGSLLFLSSEICYTIDSHMQVRVHAEVVKPEEGSQETTNTFHFTFATKNGTHVKGVMPKTYADGMLYLSAKRHYNQAKVHNQEIKDD